MAHIVLADDGVEFDGRTPTLSALGGAESTVVALCEALAARGHRVEAYTRRVSISHWAGVDWHSLSEGLPERADLYIANRSNHLIGAVAKAKQVFWTHNPCRYMMKLRYLWPLWRVKPTIVFLGDYHASTYPAWAPDGGRVQIAHGVDRAFLEAVPATVPPQPKAIWTSNPMRGLEGLLDLWERAIAPKVPGAELHVFFSAAVYGENGVSKASAMGAILDRARAMHPLGVVVRDPLPRAELVSELVSSRVMLYRGDENETFCLAVAEAQTVGLPAVVRDVGSLPERVIHEKTGIVASDDDAYAAGAIRCLRDDEAWRRFHQGALDPSRRLTWDKAAAAFEGLMS